MAQKVQSDLMELSIREWLTLTYIPDPEIREYYLSAVDNPEEIRDQIVPDPPPIPASLLKDIKENHVGPLSELLNDEIVAAIASGAARQAFVWLVAQWEITMEKLPNPPRHGAAHYRMTEKGSGPSFSIRTQGLDMIGAYERLKGVFADIRPEEAVEYSVARGLAAAVLYSDGRYEAARDANRDTDIKTEMLHASRRYASLLYYLWTEAFEELLEDNTPKGRIYLLERWLHVKPGGWSEGDGKTRRLLKEHELEELKHLEKKALEREREAAKSKLWHHAFDMYQGRQVIKQALTEKIRSLFETPVNPFEGTTEAYDYCNQVVDAWDEGCKSGRQMKEMNDLWREVGTDYLNVQQSVRNVLKKAGIRAGSGYERGNPQSFVTAVQDVLDEYNIDR